MLFNKLAMKNKLLLNIGIIFFSGILLAQTGNVATIGNESISTKEFIERFEFTPRVDSDYLKDSAKINFLYSLIAEKLWAKEGERLGGGKSLYVKSSVENVYRKLLRDKLYKEEIEKNVKVTPKDFSRDLKKLHKKLILNFIFEPNKNNINQIYKKLTSGAPFDSLLKGRKEFSEQKNGVPILYGDMQPQLENKVFALKVGGTTSPIKIGNDWVIYHLNRVEYIKIHPKFPNKSDEKIVEDVVFDRKARREYQRFFRENIMGKVVKSNKHLSKRLSRLLFEKLKNDSVKAYNPNDNKYYLNYYSILSCKGSFGTKELLSSFIKFKKHPISLAEFIEQLAVEGFSVNSISSEEVEIKLERFIKKFIYNSLLEKLAVKKGYGKSPDVQKDLKMWRESFLASYYRNSFLDSITVNNAEIRKYYNKIKSLIPDSLNDKYDYVRKKLSSGLYFKKLKGFYEKRTVALALKYGVKINRKKLNSLKVTSIEMLVYRYLGFGGTITAVPYTIPFYKWKNWLPKKIINSFKD